MRPTDQRGFDFLSGSVGGMKDTAMTMAAFTREMIALLAVWLDMRIKQDALIDKPLHAGTGVAGDKLHRVAIANSGAGNQRIFDMRRYTVGFIKHGGNTALRIKRGALAHRPFTQDDNLMFFSQTQRQRESGRAAADN
ncbi:Uncharacterised protein [Salmonella enterica subsp. enterica serovar Bovismorbificans]|nr:Uncharacterised protein [Salmonella enterica subsp. enterica serovar Bovismorbificans]